MANVTRQTSGQSGGDTASTAQQQTAHSESVQNQGRREQNSETESAASTQTTVNDAYVRKTTSSNPGQVNVANEDHAFTIAFTVQISSELPCQPIPLL